MTSGFVLCLIHLEEEVVQGAGGERGESGLMWRGIKGIDDIIALLV